MNDLISRAAANDAYCMHECGMRYTECDDEYCGSIFADIPSAQPERKKGKWIPQDSINCDGGMYTASFYLPKCSVCGESAFITNFCPNCGADMRGEDHETD